MNLKHVVEGWRKSFRLMEVSLEAGKLSDQRMLVCSTCPWAKESSFLKFFGREAKELGAIVCTKCGCPVNEKTLVTNEKCPLGKW